MSIVKDWSGAGITVIFLSAVWEFTEMFPSQRFISSFRYGSSGGSSSSSVRIFITLRYHSPVLCSRSFVVLVSWSVLVCRLRRLSKASGVLGT